MPKVDNAIIMAAGLSSRFAPLSYERHKALITVKGEVLIERQIRQLREAGIPEIVIVVGYKKEQFDYLKENFGVVLVENPEYSTRNNNGSIYAARHYLKNSYICSSDNYFAVSPFEREVDESYYAALYAHGETKEWCMTEDENGFIDSVTIGGAHAYYMLGHAFWTEAFSRKFLEILLKEYHRPETAALLWESIFMRHLPELPMRIRKYASDDIFEFDSLDELRDFDEAYKTDSGSPIMKKIAALLSCGEGELTDLHPIKNQSGGVIGVSFNSPKGPKNFYYEQSLLEDKPCPTS